MKLFPGAAMEMRAARLRELRGLTDDMESHALYTRLKVAAALALLDGHDRVREEDWTLSGFVMRISNRTREYVQKHLAQKAHDANIAAGRAKGVQNEVAETTAFKKTLLTYSGMDTHPSRHGGIHIILRSQARHGRARQRPCRGSASKPGWPKPYRDG